MDKNIIDIERKQMSLKKQQIITTAINIFVS